LLHKSLKNVNPNLYSNSYINPNPIPNSNTNYNSNPNPNLKP